MFRLFPVRRSFSTQGQIDQHQLFNDFFLLLVLLFLVSCSLILFSFFFLILPTAHNASTWDKQTAVLCFYLVTSQEAGCPPCVLVSQDLYTAFNAVSVDHLSAPSVPASCVIILCALISLLFFFTFSFFTVYLFFIIH